MIKGLTIRAATGPQCPIVAALEARYFPGLALSSEQVRYYANRGPGLVLVALLDGRVIGYLVAMLARRGRSPTLWIVTMGVAPSRRRRGVGKRLLRRAISWGLRVGAARVKLEVSTRNAEAVRLYKSIGFEVEETMPGYYQPGRDAFRMSRALGPRKAP